MIELEPKIEIFRRTFTRTGASYWERVSNTPRYDTVTELFQDFDAYAAKLADPDKTNLYYSQGLTALNPDKKDERNYKNSRSYHGQNIVLWDIDHIPMENADKIIDKTCEFFGLDKSKTGIVKTGYGVQLAVGVEKLFYSDNVIKAAHSRKCEALENFLRKEGLFQEDSNVDKSVIDPNSLARLGSTINFKPTRPSAPSIFINKNIEPQFESVELHLNITEEDKTNLAKDPKQRRITFEVDEPAVREGCGFLKHRLEDTTDIHEPEVRAVAAILKGFTNGEELAFEYFSKVRGSGDSQTVSKFSDSEIRKRVATIAPYSCETIKAMSEKCATCPHFNKGAPLRIKSPEFLLSKAKGTGFRYIAKNGLPGKVKHESLVEFYKKENPYFVSELTEHTKTFYQFNGKFYEDLHKAEILKFAMEHVEPSASSAEREEFFSRIALDNPMDLNKLFHNDTEGHINFENGVLNIRRKELLKHDSGFGFTYVLPYEYDPEATCPRWEATLAEYMKGTEENIEILQMYGGYVLAGGSCKAQAILILTGGGQNGKSVFWKLLGKIMGWIEGGAFSTMKEPDLAKSHALAALRTKLLCVIEEPDPYTKSTFWEALKDYSAGGVISGSHKFKNQIEFENRSKFIIAMNQFSSGTAQTYGFIRRLKIVHFPHQIAEDKRISEFEDVLLKAEGPGIVNWFIEGYRKLEALDFKFPTNSAMAKTIEEYQMDTNMTYAFCKEMALEYGSPCEEGFATGNLNIHSISPVAPGIFTDELYTLYHDYVKDQYGDDLAKARIEPKNVFMRKIKQVFPKADVRKIGPRESRKRVLMGVRSNPEP